MSCILVGRKKKLLPKGGKNSNFFSISAFLSLIKRWIVSELGLAFGKLLKDNNRYLISKEPLNNRLVEKANQPEFQNEITLLKPITILYCVLE